MPKADREAQAKAVKQEKKMFVKQGINNMTMGGMKHFKNQSLNF